MGWTLLARNLPRFKTLSIPWLSPEEPAALNKKPSAPRNHQLFTYLYKGPMEDSEDEYVSRYTYQSPLLRLQILPIINQANLVFTCPNLISRLQQQRRPRLEKKHFKNAGSGASASHSEPTS